MKKVLCILLAFLVLAGSAAAETAWVMLGPDDYVNVRIKPAKKSTITGYIDTGDAFETDGLSRNGFLQVLGVGENGEGWVFSGYVTDEKPEPVNDRYVCVARNRVACRRWIDGPRIRGKAGWLYNGSTVKVYYRTSEWSVTNRGYIRSEWLEVDPE